MTLQDLVNGAAALLRAGDTPRPIRLIGTDFLPAGTATLLPAGVFFPGSSALPEEIAVIVCASDVLQALQAAPPEARWALGLGEPDPDPRRRGLGRAWDEQVVIDILGAALAAGKRPLVT